jgi:hypothetical protein
MSKLGSTIAGIIRNMNPAMICMCEVGEASIPLTKECMQQVSDQTMQAWRDVATEHVKLTCMFEVGAPYMTVYDLSKVQCSCHRIFTNLYPTHGQQRTAQAFLCSGPSNVSVDVIDVHLPSGKPRLTDPQRKQFITTVLQSKSMSMDGCTQDICHIRMAVCAERHVYESVLMMLNDPVNMPPPPEPMPPPGLPPQHVLRAMPSPGRQPRHLLLPASTPPSSSAS